MNSMTGPSSSEDEARQLRLRREKLYDALKKSEREWESAWDSSREYLRKVRELAMEAAYNMDAGLVNETGDILCRVEDVRVKADNEFEQVILVYEGSGVRSLMSSMRGGTPIMGDLATGAKQVIASSADGASTARGCLKGAEGYTMFSLTELAADDSNSAARVHDAMSPVVDRVLEEYRKAIISDDAAIGVIVDRLSEADRRAANQILGR